MSKKPPIFVARDAPGNLQIIRAMVNQRPPNQPSSYFEVSPCYLRALIEAAGFTQAEAAARLGIDARSMRRYLLAERPIPYLVRYALEQLAAAHDETQEIRS
jgi:hypothetical protein